jgi:hypothetical protein
MNAYGSELVRVSWKGGKGGVGNTAQDRHPVVMALRATEFHENTAERG